jgi:hypothetical protein
MYTTVTFTEVSGGTNLRIVTRFASDQELDNAEAIGMVEGFTDAMNRLEEYLRKLIGGPMLFQRMARKSLTTGRGKGQPSFWSHQPLLITTMLHSSLNTLRIILPSTIMTVAAAVKALILRHMLSSARLKTSRP